MKLKTAQVTNFKCVEDSTPFDVDQVTCLVGKNESGKTTLLQALYRLSPYRAEDRGFDKDLEYPRRFVNDYAERHQGRPATALTTTWLIEAHERQDLIAMVGQHWPSPRFADTSGSAIRRGSVSCQG